MYLPIARSVILKRRNQTTIDLLGNVFIHNAARSRLSPQMAKLCKERIPMFDYSVCKAVFPDVKVHLLFLDLQAMTPEVNIIIFHLEQLGFVHITETVHDLVHLYHVS